MELRLPADKLQRVNKSVQEWLGKDSPIFLQMSLGTRPDPSPIPSQALRLLVEEQPDWTPKDKVFRGWYQAGLAFSTRSASGREEVLFELLHPGKNNTIASGGACPVPVCDISMDRGSPTSESKILLVSSETLEDFTRPGISSMLRLELVVCGLKLEQTGTPGKVRLPITPTILIKVYTE